MRAYLSPFLPWRARIMLDTDTATQVHTRHRVVLNRRTGAYERVDVETLYRSPAGRWFFTSQTTATETVQIQLATPGYVRRWLLKYAAPPDVLKTYFPRSFIEG